MIITYYDNVHRGTGTFCSPAFSILRAKVLGNFRSRERKFLLGTFAPWNFNLAMFITYYDKVHRGSGTFDPRHFRFSERKFPLGTFAPWNESSRELSLPGAKVPGNFCLLNFRSRELKFPLGTFFPQSDIPGSDLYE